jgi:hypothetical protein
MKKRLKKKIMKQLALKTEHFSSTGERPEPTELEAKLVESIFTSELNKFQMKEYKNGTLYSPGYLERMQQKVKEIDDMFNAKNLLERAKQL